MSSDSQQSPPPPYESGTRLILGSQVEAQQQGDLDYLWRLVAELTDQLAQNRSITASLQAQAGAVKSAASHQGTGFALRRFNTHLSQDAFESELERMNAAFVQQNAELQNDNKQLAALLKEYEQTLENVMSKFRNHAHAAQQHELSLTRHYESLLLSRETSVLNADLAASTACSHSLARISHLLRAALRAAGGEPFEEENSDDTDSNADQGSYIGGSSTDDWALERESELARLEYENYELRRMLGILPPPLPPPPSPPPFPSRWEGLFEGEHHQSGLGVFNSGHVHPDASDDLSLRRQPSHFQDLPPTQISLEANPSSSPLHAQTQPLHIAFPPDAPLVTRKYGRRSGSGSGSFIGGGGGGGGAGGGTGSGGFFGAGLRADIPGMNTTTGPFGTFRPGTGIFDNVGWQDSPVVGPGERIINLPQERDMNLLGTTEMQGSEAEGFGGDERMSMYIRGAGRRPPAHDA